MTRSVKTIHSLFICDSQNEVEECASALKNLGLAVRNDSVDNGEDLKNQLARQQWDLLLIYSDCASLSSAETQRILGPTGQNPALILMNDEPTEELRLESMQAGFKDVVSTGNYALLASVINREISNVENKAFAEAAERKISEVEKRCELLLDSSKDAIAYISEGIHVYVNGTYAELFGYSATDDMDCLPLMDIVNAEDDAIFKQMLKEFNDTGEEQFFPFNGIKEDGSKVTGLVSFSRARYDEEECLQVLIRDNQDEEVLKQKIKEMSEIDLLTGLHNRYAFVDRLERRLGDDSAGDSAAVYIEIDNYSSIKDTHGIKDSDVFIKQVAAWLRDDIGEEVYLAYAGEGAFALLSLNDTKFIENRALKLVEAFPEVLFEAGDQTVSSTLSVGIAEVDPSIGDAESIFSNAHAAAVSVQGDGGGNAKVYNPAIDSVLDDNDKKIIDGYLKAQKSDKLRLFYQPLQSLHGKGNKMYQSFLRFENEDGEWVFPDELMPILNKAHLLPELDDWVLSKAIEVLAEQYAANNPVQLMVHVSQFTLSQDGFVEKTYAALASKNVPNSALIFVLKENTVKAYLKRIVVFCESVKENQGLTCLTNFGASEGTQKLLDHLPVDFVSIDGSVTRDLLKEAENQELIQQLISAINTAGKNSVATHVEDASTLAFLWPLGAHYVQGKYIQPIAPELSFDFDNG